MVVTLEEFCNELPNGIDNTVTFSYYSKGFLHYSYFDPEGKKECTVKLRFNQDKTFELEEDLESLIDRFHVKEYSLIKF